MPLTTHGTLCRARRSRALNNAVSDLRSRQSVGPYWAFRRNGRPGDTTRIDWSSGLANTSAMIPEVLVSWPFRDDTHTSHHFVRCLRPFYLQDRPSKQLAAWRSLSDRPSATAAVRRPRAPSVSKISSRKSDSSSISPSGRAHTDCSGLRTPSEPTVVGLLVHETSSPWRTRWAMARVAGDLAVAAVHRHRLTTCKQLAGSDPQDSNYPEMNALPVSIQNRAERHRPLLRGLINDTRLRRQIAHVMPSWRRRYTSSLRPDFDRYWS